MILAVPRQRGEARAAVLGHGEPPQILPEPSMQRLQVRIRQRPRAHEEGNRLHDLNQRQQLNDPLVAAGPRRRLACQSCYTSVQGARGHRNLPKLHMRHHPSLRIDKPHPQMSCGRFSVPALSRKQLRRRQRRDTNSQLEHRIPMSFERHPRTTNL